MTLIRSAVFYSSRTAAPSFIPATSNEEPAIWPVPHIRNWRASGGPFILSAHPLSRVLSPPSLRQGHLLQSPHHRRAHLVSWRTFLGVQVQIRDLGECSPLAPHPFPPPRPGLLDWFFLRFVLLEFWICLAWLQERAAAIPSSRRTTGHGGEGGWCGRGRRRGAISLSLGLLSLSACSAATLASPSPAACTPGCCATPHGGIGIGGAD